MKISFKSSIEPLSIRSKKGVSSMADSQAYHILFRELMEYCRGNIGGRSILISGHRGSGKTTLVQKAIKNIKSSLIDQNNYERTLLLIEIHGPSLFLDFEKLQKDQGIVEKNEKEHNNNEKLNEGNSLNEKEDPTTNALKMLTMAIYKSFSKELVNKFELIKERSNHIDNSLIARLVLDLENAASQNELGLFWRKASLLNHVGYKELLAVASASQAYRTVIGTVVDKRESSNHVENEMTQELSIKSDNFQSKFKSIVNELWSLLAGSAVFGGVLVQDQTNGIFAAIAGLLTAFLTSVTLNITSKKTRKTTYKRELTFMRDLSLNTLNREIPTLIERMKEAGYYPVFVIDELDKVLTDHRELDYFQTLIRNLKHLIADRSFFCFLTDRNYFDYLSDLSKRNPYPIEHTLFSKRLFISHNPQNLHDYLNDLFEDEIKSANDHDHTKIQCFIYWNLYISRFHVGDLNKNIYNNVSRFEDDIDLSQITVPEGIANPLSSYSIQITIQLAIEYMLTHEESKLKARLEQEPHFAQIVYDTLYYPSRMWESGTRELDISQKTFREYLIERMTMFRGELLKNKPISTSEDIHKKDSNQEQISSDKSDESILSQLDFDFLYDQLTNLVNYLREPTTLNVNLQGFTPPYDKYYKPAVWNSILGIIPTEPLIDIKSNRKYSWNYDFYGRKLNPELTRTEEGEMLKIAEMIFEFDDLLKKLSDGDYIFLDKYRFEQGYNPRPEIMQTKQSDSPIRIDYIIIEDVIDDYSDQPEDILFSVLNYKNTGVWYSGINDHRDRLNKYAVQFNDLIDLVGRITWLSMESCQKYDFLQGNHPSFPVHFNYYMGHIIQLRAADFNVATAKQMLQEIPELNDNKLKAQLSYYSPSINVSLSEFSIWKKNILDQIRQAKELNLEEKQKVNYQFWNIWEERLKNAIDIDFAAQPQNLTEPIDVLYLNSSIINPQDIPPPPPMQGEDIYHQLYLLSFSDNSNRYLWYNSLLKAFSNEAPHEQTYVPLWFSAFAFLWLGLPKGLNALELLVKNFEHGTDSYKKDLKNLFGNRELDKEIGDLSELLISINQKIQSKNQWKKNKCVLLLSNEYGFFQYDQVSLSQGLLELPEKGLESFSEKFVFDYLFSPDDFDQIIYYGMEDSNPFITQNLEHNYSDKITYIPSSRDPWAPQDVSSKDSSNSKANKKKLASMTDNELRDYLNNILRENVFFRS